MDSDFSAAVSHLSKSFRAGVPLRAALDDAARRYASKAWDRPNAQQLLLDQTIFYFRNAPEYGSDFYFGTARCKKFLRLLMDEIDRCPDAELGDAFIHTAAKFCQIESSSQEAFCYVIFDMPTKSGSSLSLCLRTSPLFNQVGYRVWECGLMLYAQLTEGSSQLSNSVHGKRILEVGAGSGLCAGAYIEAGVNYALLTDYRADVVENMKRNICCNVGSSDAIGTSVLDIANPETVGEVMADNAIDIIIAADMTYDEGLLLRVVDLFAKVLHGKYVGFLLAARRSEDTHNLLKSQLAQSGLLVETVSCNSVSFSFKYLVGWDLGLVQVFRLSGRK